MWQDEAQIVDFGRAFLDGAGSGWSVNLRPDGLAVVPLTFVGPAAQELWFRAFDNSMVGSRLSSLIGAAFATIVLVNLLRSRGTPQTFSFLVGALFFFDPIFVQGYKGGRIDGWAMGFVLLSCHIAGRAYRAASAVLGVSAGASATIGVLMWPSAAILGPLLLTELWPGAMGSHESGTVDEWRVPWREVVGMLIGGCLTIITAFGFVYLVRGWPFVGLGSIVTATTSSSMFGGTLSLAGMKPLAGSPLIWLLALWSGVKARNWRVLAAAGLAWLLVLGTRFYVHRIVYLLPYACILIGDMAARVPIVTKPWRFALGAAIVFAGGLSLIARPAVAVMERRVRDPEVIFEAAQSLVGSGPVKVYVDAWEFYFPGRRLGWHMLRAFDGSRDPNLLSKSDVVITRKTDAGEGLVDFKAAGFETASTFQVTRPGQQQGGGYSDFVILRRAPMTAEP